MSQPNEPRHAHAWSYSQDGRTRQCEYCRFEQPAPCIVNALPEPVRRYIHDLETMADPAGLVRENVIMRDAIPTYAALLATRDREITELQAERDAALARAEQAAVAALRWAAEQVRALRRPDTERTGLVWLDQVLVVASEIERGPLTERE